MRTTVGPCTPPAPFTNADCNNSEIQKTPRYSMVSVVVIPIIVVAIVGLVGYLVYRYLVMDMSSRRAVTRTLRRYRIDKTPSQIIREYHMTKGQPLSDGEIRNMEKEYMRNEPDRFLEMYDEIRDRPVRGGGRNQGADGDDSGSTGGPEGGSIGDK